MSTLALRSNQGIHAAQGADGGLWVRVWGPGMVQVTFRARVSGAGAQGGFVPLCSVDGFGVGGECGFWGMRF